MKPLALDLCCGIWDGGWCRGLIKAGWDVIGVDIEDQGGYGGHKILADVREVAKDVEKFFPALNFDLIVASPPCQEFSYRSFPFKRCGELAKNVPPDKSIWLACESIAKTLRKPIIIENVRGAQSYMGKARFHNGAFYFWGDVPALMPTIRPAKGFGGSKEWKDRMAMHNQRRLGGLAPGGCRDGMKRGFAGEYERENGLKKVKPEFDYARQIKLHQKEKGLSERSIDEIVGDKFESPFSTPSERVWKNKQQFGEMEHSKSGSRSNVRKEWSAKIAMIPDEIGEWIGKCFYPEVV